MKKTLRITFNGKSYDVVAEIIGDDVSVAPAPRPAAPRPSAPRGAAAATPAPVAPAPKPAAAPAAGAGDLPSPLAGKVVSIDAPVGTAVAEGQTVITLEAMKMNTTVPAPCAGTITAVHVNAGDSVEEGQALLTIG